MRRLARGRRIREQRVLGLENALVGLAPRMVRAHELVRREDAAAREERREEDQIENEEGGERESPAAVGPAPRVIRVAVATYHWPLDPALDPGAHASPAFGPPNHFVFMKMRPSYVHN